MRRHPYGNGTDTIILPHERPAPPQPVYGVTDDGRYHAKISVHLRVYRVFREGYAERVEVSGKHGLLRFDRKGPALWAAGRYTLVGRDANALEVTYQAMTQEADHA